MINEKVFAPNCQELTLKSIAADGSNAACFTESGGFATSQATAQGGLDVHQVQISHFDVIGDHVPFSKYASLASLDAEPGTLNYQSSLNYQPIMLQGA